MVYYSERLHVECAVYAGELIREGAIGRVVQVVGLGPHRLSASSRAAWFFEKAKYGGILCDIGSHQIEQFLFYSGAQDATVTEAVGGELCESRLSRIRRLWPRESRGRQWRNESFSRRLVYAERLAHLGRWTHHDPGYKGLHRAAQVHRPRDATPAATSFFWSMTKGEQHLSLAGKIGFPFFGQLILDCLNRTENAMTQRHAFKAAELCLKAQNAARRLA